MNASESDAAADRYARVHSALIHGAKATYG